MKVGKGSNTFCHVISNILVELKDSDDIIVPRRVIFVIDKSGSMSGGKWRRTVSATINAFDGSFLFL